MLVLMLHLEGSKQNRRRDDHMSNVADARATDSQGDNLRATTISTNYIEARRP